MENPRPINRCFYGLFIGVLLVSTLVAILTHDSQPLLWGLAVLGLFVLVCGVAALINLAIFPPIFRLLARLTGRHRAAHSDSSDDDAA
jgi:hypothetical protein